MTASTPDRRVALVIDRDLALPVRPEVVDEALTADLDRRRVSLWASMMGSGMSSAVSRQA